MAKSYPETIPNAYVRADLANAYRAGWNHGHGIACHNVPTLGDKVFSDSLGRVTVDAENIREIHGDACYQAESNSRSYSPFEFTAHEFNSAENDSDGQWDPEKEGLSDELWEAFEAGAGDAIAADLAEYTDADYGIPAELLWGSTLSGRIELSMTREQADSVHHSGSRDADVAALSRVPEIASQLAAIAPDLLARELAKYGCWDAAELADHDQNLQRILWILGCDISENAASAEH